MFKSLKDNLFFIFPIIIVGLAIFIFTDLPRAKPVNGDPDCVDPTCECNAYKQPTWEDKETRFTLEDAPESIFRPEDIN
jgi:hypothetical protein